MTRYEEILWLHRANEAGKAGNQPEKVEIYLAYRAKREGAKALAKAKAEAKLANEYHGEGWPATLIGWALYGLIVLSFFYYVS